MTRLNKSVREQIVDNAVRRLNLNQQVLDLIADLKFFISDMRQSLNKVSDPVVKNKLTTFQLDLGAIAEGSVFKSYYCYLNFSNGFKYYLEYSGNFGSFNTLINLVLNEEERDLITENIYEYSLTCYQKVNLDYLDKLTAFDDKANELILKVQETRSAVAQIVLSVETVKKLLEVWPQAAELLPEGFGESKVKTGLPAVPIERINALLGLQNVR